MRLIENRISMEFMLQVNKLVFIFFSAVINIVLSVFHSTENSICLFLNCFPRFLCRSSTSSWVSPAPPLPRNTRVKCGVRCCCPLTPSLNPSPTSRAKTSAPWLNNGCILAHLDAVLWLSLQNEIDIPKQSLCRLTFTLDSANVMDAANNGSFSGFLRSEVFIFGMVKHSSGADQ